MKVKANFDYNDLQLNRLVNKDEVIEVDQERAKQLTTLTYANKPFCSIVEEEKEDKKECPIEEAKVETAIPKKRGRKAVKNPKVEE